MPEGFTLVRLRTETKRMLENVRETMLTAEAMGLREFVHDWGGRVGLDQVVQELVYFYLKHAARRRESAARRRGARKQAKATAAGATSSPPPATAEEEKT